MKPYTIEHTTEQDMLNIETDGGQSSENAVIIRRSPRPATVSKNTFDACLEISNTQKTHQVSISGSQQSGRVKDHLISFMTNTAIVDPKDGIKDFGTREASFVPKMVEWDEKRQVLLQSYLQRHKKRDFQFYMEGKAVFQEYEKRQFQKMYNINKHKTTKRQPTINPENPVKDSLQCQILVPKVQNLNNGRNFELALEAQLQKNYRTHGNTKAPFKQQRNKKASGIKNQTPINMQDPFQQQPLKTKSHPDPGTADSEQIQEVREFTVIMIDGNNARQSPFTETFRRQDRYQTIPTQTQEFEKSSRFNYGMSPKCEEEVMDYIFSPKQQNRSSVQVHPKDKFSTMTSQGTIMQMIEREFAENSLGLEKMSKKSSIPDTPQQLTQMVRKSTQKYSEEKGEKSLGYEFLENEDIYDEYEKKDEDGRKRFASCENPQRTHPAGSLSVHFSTKEDRGSSLRATGLSDKGMSEEMAKHTQSIINLMWDMDKKDHLPSCKYLVYRKLIKYKLPLTNNQIVEQRLLAQNCDCDIKMNLDSKVNIKKETDDSKIILQHMLPQDQIQLKTEMAKIGADLDSLRPMENAHSLQEDQAIKMIEMINELKKNEDCTTRIQRFIQVPPKRGFVQSQLGHNTLYHHQQLPVCMKRPESSHESMFFKKSYINNKKVVDHNLSRYAKKIESSVKILPQIAKNTFAESLKQNIGFRDHLAASHHFERKKDPVRQSLPLPAPQLKRRFKNYERVNLNQTMDQHQEKQKISDMLKPRSPPQLGERFSIQLQNQSPSNQSPFINIKFGADNESENKIEEVDEDPREKESQLKTSQELRKSGIYSDQRALNIEQIKRNQATSVNLSSIPPKDSVTPMSNIREDIEPVSGYERKNTKKDYESPSFWNNQTLTLGTQQCPISRVQNSSLASFSIEIDHTQTMMIVQEHQLDSEVELIQQKSNQNNATPASPTRPCDIASDFLPTSYVRTFQVHSNLQPNLPSDQMIQNVSSRSNEINGGTCSPSPKNLNLKYFQKGTESVDDQKMNLTKQIQDEKCQNKMSIISKAKMSRASREEQVNSLVNWTQAKISVHQLEVQKERAPRVNSQLNSPHQSKNQQNFQKERLQSQIGAQRKLLQMTTLQNTHDESHQRSDYDFHQQAQTLPQIKNKRAQPANAKTASQIFQNDPIVEKNKINKNRESISGDSNETLGLEGKQSSIVTAGTPFNFSPHLQNKLKMKKYRRTEMGNYTKNKGLGMHNYKNRDAADHQSEQMAHQAPILNHGAPKYGSSTAMSHLKTDPVSTLCAKKTTMDASELIPSQNAPMDTRVTSPDQSKSQYSNFKHQNLKNPIARPQNYSGISISLDLGSNNKIRQNFPGRMKTTTIMPGIVLTDDQNNPRQHKLKSVASRTRSNFYTQHSMKMTNLKDKLNSTITQKSKDKKPVAMINKDIAEMEPIKQKYSKTQMMTPEIIDLVRQTKGALSTHISSQITPQKMNLGKIILSNSPISGYTPTRPITEISQPKNQLGQLINVANMLGFEPKKNQNIYTKTCPRPTAANTSLKFYQKPNRPLQKYPYIKLQKSIQKTAFNGNNSLTDQIEPADQDDVQASQRMMGINHKLQVQNNCDTDDLLPLTSSLMLLTGGLTPTTSPGKPAPLKQMSFVDHAITEQQHRSAIEIIGVDTNKIEEQDEYTAYSQTILKLKSDNSAVVNIENLLTSRS